MSSSHTSEMTNIAPFVPKYVRVLHSREESIEIPYSQTQFGVVLMVDVVGFSKLSTLASEKSQSGAEAIAMEIGAYMGECIQIIEYFGGDVVKFLGDAVLVCFQQDMYDRRISDGTSSGSEGCEGSSQTRQRNVLVRKAIECGLQLLTRLSHYRVYLTAEERARHRKLSADATQNVPTTGRRKVAIFGSLKTTGSEESFQSQTQKEDLSWTGDNTMSFDRWKCFNFILAKNKNRKSSSYRRFSTSTMHSTNSQTGAIDLELHIALSCGEVTNVVVGDIVSNIYPPKDALNTYPRIQAPDQDSIPPFGSYFLEYYGRLEYAIGGPVVDSLSEALSAAKAGEMCITQDALDIVRAQGMILEYEQRNNYYIVRSSEYQPLLRRPGVTLRAQPSLRVQPSLKSQSSLKSQTSLKTPTSQWRINTQPSTGTVLDRHRLAAEPLIPRVRNTSFLNLPVDKNPHYFKYISRSSLYRLQHSTSGDILAQFRETTIMFVSLGKMNVVTKDGLDIVQKALVSCLHILLKYEGMLQQFAIDDKGATILAVFGLPPLSHEREAVFAAKAAVELRDAYREQNLPGFAIALATGIIFTAVVPKNNPFRRDPGISGDTIILAVRMLKIRSSKQNIVCDYPTRQQIGDLCEYINLGDNYVKGKTKPIQVYEIKHFATVEPRRLSTQTTASNTDFIGYQSEMDIAVKFINDWDNTRECYVLVISGPSGVGKSYFCRTLCSTVSLPDVVYCWAASAEVEKSSKFYLIKSLMFSLFETIDSQRIPTNTKQNPTLFDDISGMNQNNQSSSNSRTESKVPLFVDTSVSSSTMYRDWINKPIHYPALSPVSPNSCENYKAFSKDIEELVERCLLKCGESELYLPLFKMIFPSLNGIEENKETESLDGRSRDIVISRIVINMINYASSFCGLLFVCDDAQWIDSASIKLLQEIHEQCRNVILIIASRPTKDYDITFFKRFSSSGQYKNIALDGLNNRDIGEVILKTFNAGVTRVSPEIINVVQKCTSGNPLYVKNMAIILKDFNHVTVMDGELVPSSSRFEIDDQMGYFEYKRLIKMQYDRLDINFQEFLAAASCLGQSFKVQEVKAVLSTENTILQCKDPRDTWNIIKTYDRYRFLRILENGDTRELDYTLYTFSHSTIPQCINTMVSYETRMTIHTLFAHYYEKKLTKGNYYELLGKITRHYLETDSLNKQLHYLEELGNFNMKSYLIPEATLNYEKIVNILDNNQDLYLQFGIMHISDIYINLGLCYTMRTKLEEGEVYLFKALDCLGEPWPKTERQFLWKFWINRADQYRHRRWGVRIRHKNDTRTETWKRIIDIMKPLSNIYFYNGNGRDFVYTCLLGLNACERLGDIGPKYTMFLARNALLCWVNDQKEKSIFYITKALRNMDLRTDSDTLTICAFLSFAAGKFDNARDLLYQSIQASLTLGTVVEFQSFYRSVKLLVTMGIFGGNLDSSPKDVALLKQMASTAHSNGDSEAEIWLGVYNVGNCIVTNRLHECLAIVSLLEAHYREAAIYNQIAIHGTLVCYYAKLRNYEQARDHTQKLITVLPALTGTPNIFPVLGLIFVTMGLYSMVEDNEVELVCSLDSGNYQQFATGLTKINHAFQQVKFWEFTQPCLYLARALPFILTGRIVEGYMVLHHGVLEMHFIEEIRFLKAYYWSFLGKYAFKPTERIRWTEEARNEFRKLKIPDEIYCNPDPGNCYARGTPANIRINSTF
ncbi:hypothetical protein CLU79DRAFT_891574 [Phycomyces nitens]|nr:hypothetical protein CLU79DRAFT_891574 [Phycomyces nitens]